MMIHKIIFKCSAILLSSLLGIGFASAQSATRIGRDANKAYLNKDYAKAGKLYKETIKKDKGMSAAYYGLGNSLYQQKKYKEAVQEYSKLLNDVKIDPKQGADAFFNLGNTFMRLKDYQKAVDTYKKSLILAPQDEKARYNYTLAKKLLQQQQQQQQQNKDQKNNDKNKDQKQDQKDQDKKPQNQDNKQKQDKDQDQKENPQNLDKQSAENILDAFKQDEEKTRKRIEQFQKQKNKNKNHNQKSKNW